MDISLKQLLAMLRFMWLHAPLRQKFVLLPLAIVAGFSRDYVMIVVNKAAAAPLDVAVGYWLPMFIAAFVVVIGSFYFYQIVTVMVTTYVANTVRMNLINRLMKVQPNFLDRQEHGAIYHILTTDVTNVANFTSTIPGLLVRRQIFWNRRQREGMEALAHLGFHVRRHTFDEASVGF